MYHRFVSTPYTFPERRRGRPSYPFEVVDAVLRALQDPAKTYQEIAEANGVSISTVHYWRERAKKNPGWPTPEPGQERHDDVRAQHTPNTDQTPGGDK